MFVVHDGAHCAVGFERHRLHNGDADADSGHYTNTHVTECAAVQPAKAAPDERDVASWSVEDC